MIAARAPVSFRLRADESKIIYRSKDNRSEQIFDPLDRLTAMTSYVHNQREQMVR
jgi:hypothetical protein